MLTAALSSEENHRYPTTHAGERTVKASKLALANSSFRWRASTQYARLPKSLREEPEGVSCQTEGTHKGYRHLVVLLYVLELKM